MSYSPQSILEQAGLASGLLSQAQIDQAWHLLVHGSAGEDRSLDEVTDLLLGEQLVRLGLINAWQVEQLSQGRTKFNLGPYRIVDTLGQGGMGHVFKGEHVLLGRVEAIKVLPRRQTDAASIAAFQREIRSQAQLDHPNLVRLSYADKDGETYFLVTEYVPGLDLRRMLRQHGPFSAQQASLIGSQVAEALAYAHQRGLVHRDVKPGNVLVTPEGVAKLTDLGLSRFSSEIDDPRSSPAKHIVGTPDFVSPESIISPGEVYPSSDIYSLGCTLYYAVTGKVPFPGGNTASKLRRHVEEAPITPHKLAADLDDDFVQVIGEMMHKDRAVRTASAQAVVERLKPWIGRDAQRAWQQLGRIARSNQQEAPPIAAAPDRALPQESTPSETADASSSQESAVSESEADAVADVVIDAAPRSPDRTGSTPRTAARAVSSSRGQQQTLIALGLFAAVVAVALVLVLVVV